MRITFLVLIFTVLTTNSLYSQSCLPDGLRIWNTADINEFLQEYPDCTCILGDLYIRGNYSNSNPGPLAGLIQLQKVVGNVTLEYINNGAEQLKYLDSIRYIGGNLTIQSIQSKNEMQIFHALKEIGGNFFIRSVYYNDSNFNYATEFGNSFPNLKRVIGDFRVEEFMKNLTGLNQLTYVGGDFDLNYLSGVTNVDRYSSLDTIGGDLEMNVWPSLKNAHFDGLKFIGGEINFWKCYELEEVSFNSLTHVGEDIRFSECNAMNTPLQFPLLSKINGDLKLIELEESEQIANFPVLETIEEEFWIKDCESCKNFNGFPNLKHIGGDFDIDSNKDLTSIEGLSSISSINGSLDLSSAKITSLIPIRNTIQHIGRLNGTGRLKNLKGLENLKRLGGVNSVSYMLENFYGLDSLEYLGNISFTEFTRLKKLEGLEHIDTLRSLYIKDNVHIESLEGGVNPKHLKYLRLFGNPNLNTCGLEWICEEIDQIETVTIFDNGPECISKEKVKDVCLRRYKIYLQSYYDLNENGMKDENEKYITGPSYNIHPQDNYAYFTEPETPFMYVAEGSYEITVDPVSNQNWVLTSSNEINYVTLDSTNTSDTLYFGFLPNELNTSLDVTFATSLLRCNEFVGLSANYYNSGNSVLNGTHFITLDHLVDSITFEIPPDTIVNDSIYGWDYENLFPGHSTTYAIHFKVPGPLEFEIGDKLYFQSNSEFKDQNNSENIQEYKYAEEIRCSYDPNDKLTHPLFMDKYTLLDEKITYTIRFQNTGNDEAYDIIIRDTLDENLNLNTFRVIASSHSPLLSTILDRNSRATAFVFNNIYLPDSTTNEPESHGFVTYTISPNPNLEEYTSIENTASIYFDYNPPIITNTAENVLVSEFPTVSTKDVLQKFNIYPNPTDTYVTIESSDLILEIKLLDLSGKLLYSTFPENNKATLNLSDFSKGLHFLTILGVNENYTRKLILY
ncbi:MAG: T9SS type A sorting domain-containing protein [Saprospiraceae bacterium]|nr:T9SS type A sorting domain-containing protein [Saprospiraceae bacterium]